MAGFRTHTLWNGVIDEIRLFSLCDLGGRFLGGLEWRSLLAPRTKTTLACWHALLRGDAFRPKKTSTRKKTSHRTLTIVPG
jgi:hypothetical protein